MNKLRIFSIFLFLTSITVPVNANSTWRSMYLNPGSPLYMGRKWDSQKNQNNEKSDRKIKRVEKTDYYVDEKGCKWLFGADNIAINYCDNNKYIYEARGTTFYLIERIDE